MLGKLFKYEWKAMSRIMLPLFAILLVISAVSGLCFDFMNSASINIVRVFVGLINASFFALIFTTLCITPIMSIARFKSNLFEREGYIMNTLPATASQHIFAKLFVSLLYEAVAFVACGISCAVFTMALGDFNFFGMVYMCFVYIGKNINSPAFGTVVLSLFEVLVICILSYFSAMLLTYVSISIGHSFSSHKKGISIAAFMAVFAISNILLAKIMVPLLSNIDIDKNMAEYAGGNLFMLAVALILALFCVTYFFITRYFMKNKLNLQ